MQPEIVQVKNKKLTYVYYTNVLVTLLLSLLPYTFIFLSCKIQSMIKTSLPDEAGQTQIKLLVSYYLDEYVIISKPYTVEPRYTELRYEGLSKNPLYL